MVREPVENANESCVNFQRIIKAIMEDAKGIQPTKAQAGGYGI